MIFDEQKTAVRLRLEFGHVALFRAQARDSGLGNARNIVRWAREERLTIRQIYQRFAAAGGNVR